MFFKFLLNEKRAPQIKDIVANDTTKIILCLTSFEKKYVSSKEYNPITSIINLEKINVVKATRYKVKG